MKAKAMDKKEQDKLEKYGKLVWDFANAKTTDDILTSFFENIQTAFDFSKNFTKKALIQIQTNKMIIDKLTSKEGELFEKLLQRNKILKSCNAAFHRIYCNVDKYDPINFMFTFTERYFYLNIPEPDQDYFEKIALIPEKTIEEYIGNRVEANADTSKIEDTFKDNLKAELNTLTNLCHQIEEIKPETAGRFAEIEKLAEAYLEIYDFHNYLKENQVTFRSILLKIIKSKNAYEAKAFKIILDGYNKIKTEYIVNKKHHLVLNAPFSEDNFLKDLRFVKKQIANGQIAEIQLLFNSPINYCLVQFLKNPEYSGKERIAICQDCRCFFGKSKLNKWQKYCSVCSKKNHTPKDIQAKRTRTSRAAANKWRDKKERKELYEQKCKQFIKDKFPQKQAEELAKLYVIEQMPVIE